MNITLLLLTHNSSESLIKNYNWLDKCPNINEIIAIDDISTDNTQNILKKLVSKTRQIKTFQQALEQDFSSQRNFGIKKSSNNWILWLDSDEIPSKKLIKFIKNFNRPKYNNYSFKRIDYFIGKKLEWGETGNIHFTRLFNKKYGKFIGKVHEIWKSSKPTLVLNLPIIHRSHTTLKGFFEKINFYSSIRAQELYDQKIESNLFHIILYPKIKFIQNYFFKFGFLDSTAGIIFALGMSFHSFLVRAKLWHLWQQ